MNMIDCWFFFLSTLMISFNILPYNDRLGHGPGHHPASREPGSWVWDRATGWYVYIRHFLRLGHVYERHCSAVIIIT